ncbi:BZ3500_MvSof-1268-A1-R1_Chr5-2g07888 [Microbotryum saponariae]|uniref:BZ3500_MvSof-1268-A1-R1_Chr5-2g07888 protein n=1 Tax=Microbotryum saponariae TaxID=289078 RepID=A0A2X0NK00_9BASI|nr:BZ3500_MvSof-1268-A1-R1_Chr5-2g07888 [Microbotryum saponariae]SDA05757.1 BZ3501_MvSof-1269-A2-R1_Chr5-2g07710 [Microbotryum saponariae]
MVLRRSRSSSSNVRYVESDDDDDDDDAFAPSSATKAPGKGAHPKASSTGAKGKVKSRRAMDDDDSDFVIEGVDAEEQDDDDFMMDEDLRDDEEGDGASSVEEDFQEDDLVVVEKGARGSKAAGGRKGASGKTSQNVYSRGKSALKGEDGTKGASLDESLPPMSDLSEIFSDLVGKVKDELGQVCDQLGNRKLRVGTMCSGTESPLLALGLISESLEELTGRKLQVEHIFSCEIEPFKQAYIERNFSPPLLFRDVTELGGEQAKTAYGSIADIPGHIDMLVAGTSCVDYSPLNTKQKTIDDQGESGRTFFGMLDYVEKHQPPIVILENVSNAPWDEVVKKFHSIKYHAVYVRLDTKHYYIPHTRSRAYLIAVPRSSGVDVVEKWATMMKKFVRPCSSPLEAFLLPTDDPRIHRARQDLSKIAMTKDGVKRAPTDWIRCEGRHAQAREQEFLGLQRPLTAWKDNGGAPTMPDGAWNDWASAQTERVWDLMDISYMRLALENTDVSYKSALWNLSQNVDRQTSNPILGISSCLTPNMIAYLASRGGPIIGLEALALQGLPINKLLLTRENTDQLADLAGNAMSSTVVGSAILAALLVARKTLGSNHPESNGDAPAGEETKRVKSVDIEGRIRGEERLLPHPVDLAAFNPLTDGFLERAAQTARKCLCEGRTSNTPDDVAIMVCDACGHSTCAKHVARPDHRYRVETGKRASPDSFIAELKGLLPMRFTLAGFDLKSLQDRVADLLAGGVPLEESQSAYYERIAAAIDGVEFHFSEFVRRREWFVTFAAEDATLELHISAHGCEWLLRVACERTLAVNDPLRKLLEVPIARNQVSPTAQNLLDGQWELAAVIDGAGKGKQAFSIDIEVVGDMVPSWRARMGLVDFLGEKNQDGVEIAPSEKRPHRMRVKMSDTITPLVDRSLDGLYELEAECGTACQSLYRRIEPIESKPLYFFFDPTRFGTADIDCFVFSDDCERLEYGEHRNKLATLAPSWRLPGTFPTVSQQSQIRVAKAEALASSGTIAVSLPTMWTPLPGSHIVHEKIDRADATFSTLSTTFELTADAVACSFADNLLVARVEQAPPARKLKWATEEWHEVDLHHEGPEVFSKISWMLTKIPAWDALREWQHIAGELEMDCQACCPPAPMIHWVKRSEQKAKMLQVSIVAVEDGQQAAQFERALKARPSPLLVHTRQTATHFEFRIGLNAATLAHRALGTLPVNRLHTYEMSEPTVIWRLKSSNGVELGYGKDGEPTEFSIPSNDADVMADQPPHFKVFQLRNEQRRSLQWMIEQEANPRPWVEEEVAEAILPQLGWQAEAKASREVTVRGGVLADAVGYGKTAITIALISARLGQTELPVETDRIAVKATLIVVPAHLTSQWPSEIEKFTQGANQNFELLTVKDLNDLRRKTIEDFRKADIILVAETVFNSPLYWPQLGDWSASERGVKYDKNAGRYFRTCVNQTVAALPAQVEKLLNNDAKGVFDSIKAARKARDQIKDLVDEPSKRLKGQAAIFAKEAAEFLEKRDGKKPEAKQELKVKKDLEKKVEADPWNLGSKDTQKDWEQMTSPPLSIFSYERIVIDEFTYTDGPQLAAVHAIRARSRWILSGTPPLETFAQVKTIANLLHVHLGVDDESEFQGGSNGARYKEKTAAEQFHSFRDVHTVGWHKNRDRIAQKFLDQFARQNWADTTTISYSDSIKMIDLPAAEMAIYRELEHHLLALSNDLGKIQRIKKEKRGDREVRLSEALGNSKSPEEALLKRCSHFSMDIEEYDDSVKHIGALHVCERILAKRVAQLTSCEDQFLQLVNTCAAQQRWLDKHGYYKGSFGTKGSEPQHFKMFLQTVFGKSQDEEGSEAIKTFCKMVGCSESGEISKIAPEGAPEPTDMGAFLTKNGQTWDDEKNRAIAGKKIPEEDYRKSKTWILRQNVSAVERLRKEVIGRYRSRRYFQCVRNVQRSKDNSYEGITLLSCCGHSGPSDEIERLVINQAQPQCIEPKCDARVSRNNFVRAETLGVDRSSGTFGVKLETLVRLILEKVAQDDRVLVFVQFEDLFAKTREALEAYGIKTAVVEGTAKQKGTTLHNFQDPDNRSHRVLLLQVTDKSASGANLTVANWAFFVSPLHTDTTQEYKAFETQAIGRIRRYGQTKAVSIFRLLTRSTIDVETFEQRTGKIVEELMAEQEPLELSDVAHPKTQEFEEMVAERSRGGGNCAIAPLVTKQVKKARPVAAPKKSRSSTNSKGKGKARRNSFSEDDLSDLSDLPAIVLSDDDVPDVDSEADQADLESLLVGTSRPSSLKKRTTASSVTRRRSTVAWSDQVVDDEDDVDDDEEPISLSSSVSLNLLQSKPSFVLIRSLDSVPQRRSSGRLRRPAIKSRASITLLDGENDTMDEDEPEARPPMVDSPATAKVPVAKSKVPAKRPRGSDAASSSSSPATEASAPRATRSTLDKTTPSRPTKRRQTFELVVPFRRLPSSPVKSQDAARLTSSPIKSSSALVQTLSVNLLQAPAMLKRPSTSGTPETATSVASAPESPEEMAEAEALDKIVAERQGLRTDSSMTEGEAELWKGM